MTWKTCLPSIGFGIGGALLIAASALYGELVHGYGLLRKEDPDFTPFGRARIVVSFVAALLFFAALKPFSRGPAEDEAIARGAGLGAIGSALIFLLAVAAAVHFVPTSLNDYVREMQPLGIATEFLLLAAIALLLLAARRALSSNAPRLLGLLSPSWVLAGMAAVVFLILMEEMSWGQHWLGWATPDLFRDNIQNETNIHNFYTYQFEAIYYTSAILCFVVLPWCWPRGTGGIAGQVALYVPPRVFALLALPIASLMYESWNIVPYQVWFFLSLMIGVDIVCRLASRELRNAAIALALVYAGTKLVFLFRGSAMVDGYELSEVREFYIALLFMIHGWMLAGRFRQHP
ncbi:hypothetical protein [Nitratireductor pacificus]|uniref:Uncharacterized protein n=1 Tax=Nitratireductor pacificus pht-3B TaxID=391937 RepID=K2MKH5_9HYPH|nr:hypothetical protein [Nitratireductor pacificus]EKF17742.1 hypothetical protein NA2_16822 [Nitratireductor pacificus pht-3B]